MMNRAIQVRGLKKSYGSSIVLGGLDFEIEKRETFALLGVNGAGKTIVLASHDMAEVENLCDRLAILNNGNIAFCGTAAELTERNGEKYFIHIQTQQGNSTFKTDNIEDTLISLLNDLRQKEIHILDNGFYFENLWYLIFIFFATVIVCGIVLKKQKAK